MPALDYVFFDLARGARGEPSEVSTIRTDRKGSVLATRGDVLAEGLTLSSALSGIERAILKPFGTEYMVVSHLGYPPDDVRGVLGDRWIFTSQLAYPLLHAESIASLRLPVVAAYFKVEYDAKNPSSEASVRTVRAIFFEMMRRYRTALIGEEALTHFQGEAVGKLRKLFGV